jgi:hypothetical protein
MTRISLISLLLYSFTSIGLTQTHNDNMNIKCYKEKIQWNIKEKQFKDTIEKIKQENQLCLSMCVI